MEYERAAALCRSSLLSWPGKCAQLAGPGWTGLAQETGVFEVLPCSQTTRPQVQPRFSALVLRLPSLET